MGRATHGFGSVVTHARNAAQAQKGALAESCDARLGGLAEPGTAYAKMLPCLTSG